MKKNKLEEHIKRIKYNSNYSINETPKYKSVMEEEFDEIPEINNNATEDGYPMPNINGSESFLEEVDNENQPQDNNLPPKEEIPQKGGEINFSGQNNKIGPEQPEQIPEPEEINTEVDVTPNSEIQNNNEVDKIQNEIIRHNIQAMKDIHDKLENLDSFVQNVNNQLNVLNSKVKEVEEPSNVEKMVSKKDVSYPYYFNLNDYWKNNWFDQQRELSDEKGIKKMEDGSYIADFDDLPLHNSIEVEDSFNDII